MSEPITNETRDMMKVDYGEKRLSKDVELNETMSIEEQAPDEYETKIKNLKGE